MGLLNPKAKTTDYVTREAFDALAAQCEALKTVTAVAVAAIGMAMKAPPGLPEANARTRLVKLAAVADLDPEERAQLRSFFVLLERLDKAEALREHAEAQARARPPTFDTMRVPSWRG